MGATLFRIILPVSDIEQAAKFYEAVLAAAGRRVSAGRHYFDCGGTILALFDPSADGDGHEPIPLPEPIYLAVDDLSATRARCAAAGAAFAAGEVHGDPAGEIATRPWGERSFYAADPFGNPLCFVQRGTEFTGQSP